MHPLFFLYVCKSIRYKRVQVCSDRNACRFHSFMMFVNDIKRIHSAKNENSALQPHGDGQLKQIGTF